MNDRILASIPSPECNEFLLAVIDEAPNGTQLTVLSALTQANCDPWEEAARLSAMSKVTAERALVSMFDRIPGRNWSSSEEAAIAARLVKLLPPRGRGMEARTVRLAEASISLVWLAWISLAIAASILSVPRHPAATVDSSVSAPSSTIVAPKSSSADGTLEDTSVADQAPVRDDSSTR
jgi:hypothetical protein